jgi:ribonuclease III
LALRDPLEPHVLGGALTPPADDAAASAEAILGHRFARAELVREALTHRSVLGGKRPGRGRKARRGSAGSNERLEFVGDRVLGLLIAEWLAERYPDEQEGDLGPRLAQLVSQPVLAAIAGKLGLPAILSVAPGESRAGVRKLATVMGDAMEALIGALYLDAGLEPARRFVRRAWEDVMAAQAAPPKDPKTELQEWLLARGMPLPGYVLLTREGPPHDPVFIIGVAAAGQEGTGTAGSKRLAERLAAADLLARLAR